ncbi:arylesterase [Tianweitania sp. BSSL-BM11]|uniref:Arylesterase n=1 Tax=Tianweitania aestuarii TaxID=2814886 RepID=A0ABS5RZ33_9HYPH|nr:arylesterase [Tianweitania aestuarii]MBS9722310.1 arylesterase [Tianweitania aestuarii]
MALKHLFASAALAMSLSMAASSAFAETLKLVGFGDSLMAGYQLGPQDSFAAKLEAALKARGHDVTVANAGVSGDTTAAGLSRIDWSVPDGTNLVVLELGANDMLRGLPPEQTRKNLDTMLKRLSDRGIPVVLVGMMAAPNLGPAYGKAYNAIFPDLAKKYGVPLVPFFLDGVIGVPGLQIEDGMHPNPKGVDVMVERSLPVIERAVQDLSS